MGLKIDSIVVIGIYVDDFLAIGNEEFKLKLEKEFVDYLSCHIAESESSNKIVMVQPQLINRLLQKCEDEIKEKLKYKIPGTPRFKIK